MTARHRFLAASVAALTVLPGVWAIAARAQLPPPTTPTTGSTSTTSTTAPPDTTTTSSPGPTTPSTPTTPSQPSTTAPEPPSTSTTIGGETTSPTDEVGSPDGPAAPGVAQTIPPQYVGYIAMVKRSAPNSTDTLLGAIQPLIDLGLTEQEAIAATFGHFPVAGPANFSDDWWYPRYNVPFHLHQGTDIFAAMGTPVRSPADGVLKHGLGGLGGMAAYVTQADGTYFYMAHLSAFVDGQADGTVVKTGDTVGYVGNTGDAAGGPTHVHFEIHMAPVLNPYLRPKPPPPPPPAKGKKAKPTTTTTTTTTVKSRSKARVTTTTLPPPVIIGDIHDPVLYGRGTLPANDPKPFLDQWLADDLIGVTQVIAKLEAGKPRAIIDTGLTRRLADGHSGELAGPTGPPRSQLLWASSASPAGGPLRLAEAEVTAAAGELDYDTLARGERARLADQKAAEERNRRILAPLTPRAIARYLRLS